MKNAYKKIIFLSIGILLLTDFPVLYGMLTSPPDKKYSGFYFFLEENFNYLSKIKQGEQGYWTWDNLYTPERTKPLPIFLFYITAGHLARFLHLSSYSIYQLSRHILVFLAIFEIYFFMHLFLGGKKAFYSLLVYSFASGAGFLYLMINPQPSTSMPVDLWVPEAIGFMTLAGPPHIIFSLAIFFRLARKGVLFFNDDKRCSLIEMNLLSVLIAVTSPYLIVSLTVFYLCCLMYNRDRLTKIFKITPWVGILIVLSEYYMVQTDPMMSAWNAQNQTRMFGIMPLIVGYLPLLLLSAGFFLDRRDKQEVLVLWLVMNIVLLYLPVSFSRRFLLGFSVILSIMSVTGLEFILNRFSIKLNPLRIFLICIIISSGNLFYLSNGIYQTKHYPGAVYSGLYSIEEFIPVKRGKTSPVIIAPAELSPLVPAITGSKTYTGHFPETINYPERMKKLKKFWKSPGKHLKDLKKEIDAPLILFGETVKLNTLKDPHKIIFSNEEYTALWIE